MENNETILFISRLKNSIYKLQNNRKQIERNKGFFVVLNAMV